MKLVSVRVEGFRCFRESVFIAFDAFTAILGRNDAGKSSILEALDIFFENVSMEQTDLCVGAARKEVVIACEFDDLPTEIVIDANVQTSLAHEYLLNAAGRLEIVKRFNCGLAKPKVTTFVRANHPTAQNAENLHSLAIAALRTRSTAVQANLTGVRQTVSSELRRAIWATFANLGLAEREISVDDEGAKKIWDQLKTQLPLFALFKADRSSTDQDSEAQDPIKLAVQEALRAEETALDAIRQRVEAEVLAVTDRTLKKLAEIDASLAEQLKPNIQKPKWDGAFKIGLVDGNAIPVNKRGSGVRRLILLNFFRAQAERAGQDRSSVIYAIEEPETSQHPTYQKMLVKAFLELSEIPGRQVVITTHNPALARGIPVQSLRMVAVTEADREVLAGNDQVYERAARDLGVLPDNGVCAFIGLEGMNDIHFFRAISRTLAAAEPDIPDLALAEDEGRIIFVPLHGSNLEYWLDRFKHLNRPEFHFLDREYPPPQDPKYHQQAQTVNQRPGCWAGHTSCREAENYLHPDAIAAEWPGAVAVAHAPFDDVPLVTAERRKLAEGGNWQQLPDKAKRQAIAGMKRILNTSVAARMTPAQLTQMDPQDDVRAFLRRVAAVLAG